LKILKYGFIYENRITRKIARTTFGAPKRFDLGVKNAVREFERRVGQRGLGVGVIGFTFLFGVFWAAIVASLLNIKKSTIIASIAVGAVISSIFWTFALAGFVEFLPSPWMLYLIALALTLFLFAYKKIRERRLLREMSASSKKSDFT
jgi:uncharacterized membrane protein